LDDNNEGNLSSVNQCGTRGYQSPEYLDRKLKDLKANDMFALGVVLFILSFGGAPFGEARSSDYRYKYIYMDNFEEFWNLIKKATKKDSINSELMDLINGLLRYDNRFTIDKIEKNLWFNGETCSDHEALLEMSKRKVNVTEKRQEYDLGFELCCIPPYIHREAED